ncbi:MAG: hypothetical protein JWN04_6129 [Myxococcaceae bacterium]|nr:hypothetical protein [Myxococcaceae bacterium]
MPKMKPSAPSLLSCLAAALLGLAGSACGDDAVKTNVDHATEATCPCRLATNFANLALCVSPSTAFAPAHVYSTSWDATKKKASCEPYSDPQPAPTAPWTSVQVSSACQGTGQLCIAIRAGSASSVSSEDCTLAMRCSDIAYSTPNQIADVAPLAGWTAQSSACAQRQEQLGAYLELTLVSDQLGCGMGLEQVQRIPVCPAHCRDDASGLGCDVCAKMDAATLTTL